MFFSLLILGLDAKKAELIVERYKKRFTESQIDYYYKTNAIDALDILEKKSVNLIVCMEKLEVINSLAFYNLLRNDSKIGQTPMIFLNNEAKNSLKEQDYDVFLPSDTSGVEVIRASFKLIGNLLEERDDIRDTDTNREDEEGLNRFTEQNVSGTLEILTLFDLTDMLYQGGQSGTLYLLINKQEAVIHFDKGELIDANYIDLFANQALVKIFQEVDKDKTALFYFTALEKAQSQSISRTIFRDVKELLVSMAIEIDHKGKLITEDI